MCTSREYVHGKTMLCILSNTRVLSLYTENNGILKKKKKYPRKPKNLSKVSFSLARVGILLYFFLPQNVPILFKTQYVRQLWALATLQSAGTRLL